MVFNFISVLVHTLFLAALTSPLPPANADTLPVVREMWAMGTRLVIAVEAVHEGSGLSWSERIASEIRSVERVLSTWDSGSQLSELNEAPPGRAVETGVELTEWLARASVISEATGRAFDPTVGALIDAWNVRGHGRHPSTREIEAARAASGPTAVWIDPSNGTVTRWQDRAWIDAGGFGKGAALLEVARSVGADVVEAMVDLGGQLWLSPGSAPRTVRVAHPADRTQTIGSFRLDPGHSVATSGTSERNVTVGGDRFGHIIDPRTGDTSPPWGSVSVVSSDPLEADALATALYVMGPDEGAKWAQAHDGVAALFLIDTPHGLCAQWTSTMQPLLNRNPDAPTSTPFKIISTEFCNGGF